MYWIEKQDSRLNSISCKIRAEAARKNRQVLDIWVAPYDSSADNYYPKINQGDIVAAFVRTTPTPEEWCEIVGSVY